MCKGVKVRILNHRHPDYMEHPWVIIVEQGKHINNDVVVGWCRTRKVARNLAKLLRETLKHSILKEASK